VTEPLRLRVVTFNIRGGAPLKGRVNLNAQARVLARLQPDLVGLQEVNRYVPRPGRFEDQASRLARLLGMEAVFRPSLGLGSLGYGNAVLCAGSPEWVRRTYLPGAGERRSLLQVWINIRGRVVRFLNAHLGLNPETRLEQARVLAAEIARNDLPLIVVGDWNASPDCAEIHALEAAGLTHCAPPEVLTFPSHEPTIRCDHIMVSPHFQILGHSAAKTQVSDHLPLVADIILR
jgi:endonuclease/exonuclease/phosphatase family metal-dependent hydrolase